MSKKRQPSTALEATTDLDTAPTTVTTPKNNTLQQTAAIAAHHPSPPTRNNHNRSPLLSTAFFLIVTEKIIAQPNAYNTSSNANDNMISPDIISISAPKEDDPELQTYPSDVDDI